MSWTALTELAMLKEGFNPTEQAGLTNAAGAVDGLADILTATILEARGVIEAAGGTLDADVTKLPNSLRPYVIALARWRWLIAFPKNSALQTEERRLAAEKAEERLADVATGEFPTEPPVASATPVSGNWNSDEQLQMRTNSGTRAND